MAERWVTLLSAWKGCEVFENIGCTGKTDLVIVHPELGPLQIDVKCAKLYQGKWGAQHTHNVKAPVWPVVVEPEGDIADWRVRWVKNRAPQGWEDFWANDNRIYTTNSTKPNESDASS